MGAIILPVHKWPTLLEQAKADYVRGNLSLGEFEDRVAELYATGREDHVAPLPSSVFEVPLVDRVRR